MGLFSRKRATTSSDSGEYDFDSEEFNFDNTTSDIEQSTSSDISNASSRNPVIRAVRGATLAVKDQVTSPEFIKQKVLKALPPDAVYVTDAVDKVASGTRKLYDDSIKELRPSVGALTRKINKLVPQNTPFVKKLTEGVDKLINGEQFSTVSTSKDEAENQQIESVLGSIFTTQAVAQEEIRVKQKAYDESKEQIKDTIESKRFDANIDVMTSISTNISKIEAYNSTIQQAYQKKALELQYRSYFLQVDQYKDQLRANEFSKANTEAIVKNTALPEFVKIKASEKFKDTMRNKFYDNITNGSLFTAPSEFIKKGFDRLGKKLSETITDVKSGLEASGSLLEMFQDSLNNEEEMAKMGIGSNNGMTGQLAGMIVSKIFDWTADQAAAHGKESLDKHKKLQEQISKGITFSKNPENSIRDFLNSQYIKDLREDNSRDGTIQKIGLGFLEKVSSYFVDKDTINATLETKKGGVVDLKEPAVFDNRTYRTINDIIPGYLSRMVFELQYMNTNGFKGEDIDNVIARKDKLYSAAGQTFDFKSNRFTSNASSKALIGSKLDTIIGSANSSYASGIEEVAIKFLGGGAHGKTLLDDLKKKPDEYKQFMTDLNNAILGNAGSTSMQGIKDSGVLGTAGEKFKKIYETKLEQFKNDKVGEAELMDVIQNVKTRVNPTSSIAQIQELINHYGEENVVEMLSARNLANRDIENNGVSVDVTSYMQGMHVAAGGDEKIRLTNQHRVTDFNQVRLDKELEEIITKLPALIRIPTTSGFFRRLRGGYDHAVRIREQVKRLTSSKEKKLFIEWFKTPAGFANVRHNGVDFSHLTDKIDQLTGTISDFSSDASKEKFNNEAAAKAAREAANANNGTNPNAGAGTPPDPSPDPNPGTPPDSSGSTRYTDVTIRNSLKNKNDRKNTSRIDLIVKQLNTPAPTEEQRTKLDELFRSTSNVRDKLTLDELSRRINNIKASSDVGKKRNIRSIDFGNKTIGYNASNTSPNGSSPLNTVSSLESKIWNYNPNRSANDPKVDHFGPMAQDMQKAGGNKLAPGGTTVDLVSANGLNMAAIKEMNEKFDGAFNLMFQNLHSFNNTLISGINKTNETLNALLQKEVSVNIKEEGKSVSINEAILANIKRGNKFLAIMANQGRVTSTASAVALNQSGVEFKDDGKGFAKSIKQVVGGTFDLATMSGSAAIKGTVTTLKVAKDNVVIPVYNNLVKLGESLKEPLKKGIKKAGELAWDGIGKVKDLTQDLVTNKVPKAINWATDKATSLKDKAMGFIKFRTNLLNEKGEVVFYKDLLQAGQYIREDTGEVIKKLSDLKGTILVKGSNIRINAQDYLGRLYDEGKKKLDIYGNKAWAYAKKGVGKAWDVATNLGEHTSEFIKNTWKGDNFLGKTIHAGAGVISRALGGMGVGLGGGMGSRPIYNVLLDIRDLLRKGNKKIVMRSDEDEKKMKDKDAKHALNVSEVTSSIKDAWENQITNKEWYKNLSEEGKELAKKQYEEKMEMVKNFSAEQLAAFKDTDNEIKEGDGFLTRQAKKMRGRLVKGVNIGEDLVDKARELADKHTQAKAKVEPESKGLTQTSDVEADVKNNIGTRTEERGDKDGFHITMFRKEDDKNVWYVPPVHAIKLGAKKDMWITGSFKGILKLFKEYKAIYDKKKEHEKLAGKPLTELHTVKGVKNVFSSIKNWYHSFDKAKTEEQTKAENSEYADTDQLKKDSITGVNKNGKSTIIGFKKADIEETTYKKIIGDVTLEYRKIKGSKNVHLDESEVTKILPYITDEKTKKQLLDNKEKGCVVNLDELVLLIKNFKKEDTSKAIYDKKKEHEKLAGKPLTELHTVKGVKNVFSSIKNWYKSFDKAKTEEQAKAENSEYADTDQLKKDSITGVNKNGKSTIIGFKKADIEETIYKKVIGDVTLEYRKIKGSKNVHLAESEVAKILPYITDEKTKKQLLDNKEKGCVVNLDELVLLIKNFKKEDTSSTKANQPAATVELPKAMQPQQPEAAKTQTTTQPAAKVEDTAKAKQPSATVELPKAMQQQQPATKAEETKSTTTEASLTREKELKDLKKELDSIDPKVIRYGSNYLDDDLELTPEQSVLLELNKTSHYIKRKKFNELIGRYDEELSSISKANDDFIKTATRNKNKEDIVSAKARKEELLKSKESILKDASDISNIKSLKEKPKDDDWVELTPDQRKTLGLDQSINGLRNKDLEAKKEEMLKLSSTKINLFDNAIKTVDEELKTKIKEEAKELKEENKKKKGGGFLGGLMSMIPGLNLFNKKAAYNDKDGDGDRDGNAEDMSKQSKEIREGQKKRGLLSSIFGIGKKEEKESKSEGGFFSGLLGGFGSLGILFRAIKFIAPAAAIAATAFGSMGGVMQALNPNATADEASDMKWDAAQTALSLYAGHKVTKGLFGVGKKMLGFGKAADAAGAVSKAGIFTRTATAAGKALGAASGASKVAKTIGVTRAILGALTGVSISGIVSGTASIIGGIISSPIVVPALIGAAVIGTGVYAYKKWKKDSDLWKIRFAQYGFTENGQDNQYFDKLHKLEQWILDNNYIQTKNETVTFVNVPTPELLQLMGVNKNSDTETNNFIAWFVNRFKPFFLNFHTLLNKNKINNPDDVFKQEDAIMQSILRDMTYNDGPYGVTQSPFPTKPSCENTLEHTKNLVEYTINSLRKKKAISNFDVVDYFRLNKESQSLEDLKNQSAGKRQQEKQSVQDRIKEKQEKAKRRLAEIEFAQKYRNEHNALTAKKEEGDEEPEQTAEAVNKVAEPPEESKSRKLIGADGNPLEFTNDPRHQEKGKAAIFVSAKNKNDALEYLNPNVKKMLFGMAAEYNYYTNKKLQVTGGYRSEAYNKSLKGAAEFSLHRLGIAIDMDSPDADKLENLGLLRKYGFTRPIQGEPWHLEPAGIQGSVTGNHKDSSGKKRNQFFENALANPNALNNDILNSFGRGGGGLGTITPKGVNIGGRNKNIALGFFNSAESKKITNSIETSTRIVNQRDQYVSDVKAKAEGMEKHSSVTTGIATKPGSSQISAKYENNEKFNLSGIQKDSLKAIDDYAKDKKLSDLDKENLKAMSFIESSLGSKLGERSEKDRIADRKNGKALGLMQVKASNIEGLLKSQKTFLEDQGIDTSQDPRKIDLFNTNTNIAFALALAKDNEERISKLVPGVPMTSGLKYLIHQLGVPSATALVRAIKKGELNEPINKAVTDHSKLRGNLSFYTDKDGKWLTVGQVVDSANRHMSNINNKLNGRNPTTMIDDASKPAATASMVATQAAVFAPATPDTKKHLGIGNTVNLRANDSADTATGTAAPQQAAPAETKTSSVTTAPATNLASDVAPIPPTKVSSAEIDKAIKARNETTVAQAETSMPAGIVKVSTNQYTSAPPINEISVVTDTLIASHSVHVDSLGVNKQILATLVKLVELYSKSASDQLQKELPKIDKDNKKEALDNTPRRPQSLRENNNPAPIKLTRTYST